MSWERERERERETVSRRRRIKSFIRKEKRIKELAFVAVTLAAVMPIV
jgi:hypothetical protein